MNDDSTKPPDATRQAGVRLDLWLWAARFFKTRSLSKKAIENGRIRLNGAAVRPSTNVHIGDRVAIERGEEKFDVDVRGVNARRGSATVARQMYAETEASRIAREKSAELRRLTRDGYEKPATKPDKRARRLIRALGDIDMV